MKNYMKTKIFRMKILLILATAAVMLSLPFAAAAENEYDYNEYSDTISSNGMTSEDWEELQSEVGAVISSQNAENSTSPSQGNSQNPKGGSFKDFKDGNYVGNGEWLLVIGIILIVLGAVGISFIVFMMVRRKRLVDAMTAKSARRPPKREKNSEHDMEDLGLFLAEFNESTRPYNGNGQSGRRIAPKSNR